MSDKTTYTQPVTPWSLNDDAAYLVWKQAKLEGYHQALNTPPLPLKNLSSPTESERAELVKRCQKTNLAVYETIPGENDANHIRGQLRGFSDSLGLKISERHRSAGDLGIVALRVTASEKQRGYIPYSRKPMNWHTDGYYNATDNRIQAMVLHCVTPANDGGVNQFLDPEIAYIRLRDKNPDLIRALMHPLAMEIPENHESDGSIRPASIGPVFFITDMGKLAMRYTARTRSISWRKDELTQLAATALSEVLANDDPMMQTVKLSSGQGILCNNVLHNRTGFDPDITQTSDRLIFRIRFHNRVKGS